MEQLLGEVKNARHARKLNYGYTNASHTMQHAQFQHAAKARLQAAKNSTNAGKHNYG